MKTSLDFFDHTGTIFDPLLSLQGHSLLRRLRLY